MDIKLKPCPFCGSKAVIKVKRVTINNTACSLEYRAMCTNWKCGVMQPSTWACDSRLEASLAWNRRADDETD